LAEEQEGDVKSYLVVPGHDERKVKAARRFGADVIVWDLEDSVPPALHSTALENIYEAWEPGDHVRIKTQDDIFSFARLLEGATIWIPKVHSQAQLQGINRPLVAIIENVKGVWNLRDLMNTTEDLRALAFGRADFCADIGVINQTNMTARLAAAQIVMATTVGEMESIDAPAMKRELVWAACDLAVSEEMGFTGKGVVYPDHLAAFDIKSDDERLAEMITSGEGCIEVNDQLIGPPMRKAAAKIMARMAAS
jgi:citrate lyase beta subunit